MKNVKGGEIKIDLLRIREREIDIDSLRQRACVN